MNRSAACGLIIVAAWLSGCSTAGYYAQSVKGQMEVWHHSRPIATVLEDPDVSEQVKAKLRLAQEIRQFALDELSLPDNGSYTEFVDLKRPYVVWSVFAAEELSLTPREWCFLIVGCVTYRGYFDQQAALDFALKNEQEGLDAYVGGVPAYSTLGWFEDPIPNTILGYREEDFAGLIFHELAHQVAFAKGDTVFNESFASAVEQVGVERWLSSTANEDRIQDYRLREERNQQVVQLILDYRTKLEAMYESDISDAAKRAQKRQLVEELKSAYAEMIQPWTGYAGYKWWFDQPINNAQLISIATYSDLVPDFLRLLANNDGDLPSFYEAVKELARMDKSERRQRLQHAG